MKLCTLDVCIKYVIYCNVLYTFIIRAHTHNYHWFLMLVARCEGAVGVCTLRVLGLSCTYIYIILCVCVSVRMFAGKGHSTPSLRSSISTSAVCVFLIMRSWKQFSRQKSYASKCPNYEYTDFGVYMHIIIELAVPISRLLFASMVWKMSQWCKSK